MLCRTFCGNSENVQQTSTSIVQAEDVSQSYFMLWKISLRRGLKALGSTGRVRVRTVLSQQSFPQGRVLTLVTQTSQNLSRSKIEKPSELFSNRLPMDLSTKIIRASDTREL